MSSAHRHEKWQTLCFFMGASGTLNTRGEFGGVAYRESSIGAGGPASSVDLSQSARDSHRLVRLRVRGAPSVRLEFH